LRVVPAASARDPEARDRLEKTRARILQILQLDQENEQCCCAAASPPDDAPPRRAGSVSMLQKIYARCS